jgi:hypothetical protein
LDNNAGRAEQSDKVPNSHFSEPTSATEIGRQMPGLRVALMRLKEPPIMSDYPAVLFGVLGATFLVIALLRLGSSLPGGKRDGISAEGGYYTPKPRWGFVITGMLFLMLGCTTLYMR